MIEWLRSLNDGQLVIVGIVFAGCLYWAWSIVDRVCEAIERKK